MRAYEIAVFVFGAGVGATASMFATGFYLCRAFEKEQAAREALRRRSQ